MKRFPLTFVAAWVLSTLFCILFVDRAASTWSFSHLHADRPIFDPATHIVDKVPALALIALAIAAAAFVWPRWKATPLWRFLLCTGASVTLAISFKEELKYIFGRTWPETWTNQNPSWIGNHVFSFVFFHGGEGWYSFPSGHMTIISSLGASLWLSSPRARWLANSARSLAIALPVLVAVGLYGCDYHWVGDMCAGTFLGIATANVVWTVYGKLTDRSAASPTR